VYYGTLDTNVTKAFNDPNNWFPYQIMQWTAANTGGKPDMNSCINQINSTKYGGKRLISSQFTQATHVTPAICRAEFEPNSVVKGEVTLCDPAADGHVPSQGCLSQLTTPGGVPISSGLYCPKNDASTGTQISNGLSPGMVGLSTSTTEPPSAGYYNGVFTCGGNRELWASATTS
jgi:hypothetical protein